MSAEPVIRLDHVSKTYTATGFDVHAVRDVSLEIGEGDFAAIAGASGSGKSTLMHIIGCLDVPTSGRYLLAGQDVSGLGENELAQVRNRQIGFVFQQFNLLASLTAWRNVELPLVYMGIGRHERRERAIDALERVGLGSRIDHRPGELSGGQQQRVAVARALVSQPAILLADEPTGNLDSASTADVLDLLRTLHQQGRTVVLITHEQDVAQAAEYVVHLRDGQVVDSGLALTGSLP